MTRQDERLARAQEEPIVGSLPDVPGILAAIRLTPGLGVHLRGLADELLVNDFPGATISRGEREMLATAVSAANDCFYCMDSHGAFATAVMESTGATERVPLIDTIKLGSSEGFDPKMQALLNIARTVRRDGRALTRGRRRRRVQRRRLRRGRPARGPDRRLPSRCTTASSRASARRRRRRPRPTATAPPRSPPTATATSASRPCREPRRPRTDRGGLRSRPWSRRKSDSGLRRPRSRRGPDAVHFGLTRLPGRCSVPPSGNRPTMAIGQRPRPATSAHGRHAAKRPALIPGRVRPTAGTRTSRRRTRLTSA